MRRPPVRRLRRVADCRPVGCVAGRACGEPQGLGAAVVRRSRLSARRQREPPLRAVRAGVKAALPRRPTAALA
eukprot:3272425-Prymnesium_polylepis.1